MVVRLWRMGVCTRDVPGASPPTADWRASRCCLIIRRRRTVLVVGMFLARIAVQSACGGRGGKKL